MRGDAVVAGGLASLVMQARHRFHTFSPVKVPLSSLIVLHANAELTVAFTFSPSVPLDAPASSRDASLSYLLRIGGLPLAGAPPVCVACDRAIVALQRVGDLVYAAFASAGDDELAAADLLRGAVSVLTAASEESPPTAARVTAFFGKITVCLHEAFGGQGHMFQTDTDVILKNAKLKAP